MLLVFQQTVLYANAALVSYYKLEEGSGTAATDSQGSNNGTLTNGPTWSTGTDVANKCFVSTYSVSFDAMNDYVSITDSASLDVTNITISAWVKSNSSTQTGDNSIVCKGTGAGGEVWCIDCTANNYRFFF